MSMMMLVRLERKDLTRELPLETNARLHIADSTRLGSKPPASHGRPLVSFLSQRRGVSSS